MFGFEKDENASKEIFLVEEVSHVVRVMFDAEGDEIENEVL